MAATTASPSISRAQTCLLVVDSQLGVTHPTYWGTTRSNPAYETNVSRLIAAFRSAAGPTGPYIIHIYHSSTNPRSALHHSSTETYPSAPGLRGIDINPVHAPQGSELVLGKSLNSAFLGECGEKLTKALEERGVRRLVVVGLSVDHCVGGTLRSAKDLGVVDFVDGNGEKAEGELVIVADGTGAFAKHGGKFDAETVHGVHLESLKGEVALVWTTEDVLEVLKTSAA